MNPVKFTEIVVKLEEVDDEWSCYFNTESGEFVMVGNEYLSIAEESEEDDFSNYMDWEREFIQVAFDVLKNWSTHEKLSDKFDVDEYQVMEDFSYSYRNENISQVLCDSISGRGAVRRFKDLCARLGIEDELYKYKENAFLDVAREWCEFKKIQYIE